MGLKENIAARKAGDEAFALLQKAPEASHGRFFETIANKAAAAVGLEVVKRNRSSCMLEADAVRFAAQGMPYGKHAHIPIKDIDPEYLLWLAESDFARDMRLYVQTPFFKKLYKEHQNG